MCSRGEMEEGSDFRSWDELIPDALGLIFRNLSLKEVVTVIPRVCKSWSKAVSGPYCWQEIDIEEWSSCCRQPEKIDRMLEMLIRRSSGSLHQLCVSRLQNDAIFAFIADNATSLQVLRLPRCEISDSIVEQTAQKLSALTFLDLSYCCKIGARALEAIGKHCKVLVTLRRNMHPLDNAGKPSEDDEANAIAATMPRLKHLEMAYNLISTTGVLKILASCSELEYLDLRGCWDADDKLFKEKFPKLKVLGPVVMDVMDFEMDEWDYCSDYSDGSEYLSWGYPASELDEYDIYDGTWGDDDDYMSLDELVLRFYEGTEEDATMSGWPTSP
ncbi:hypothetical protein SLE2022_326090 [Rubroshorea leprosula]